MSDQQVGKKEEELIALAYFLDAYEYTTGVHLDYTPIVSQSERPDFVCQAPTGEPVGIEITEVIVQRNAVADSTQLCMYDVSEALFAAAEEKDAKRRSPGWRLPNNTILVLQVFGTDVDELADYLLATDLPEDFNGFGFREIWISNHGSVEAYGGVTLFGLYPNKWWGAHARWNQWAKPYG